MYEIHFHEIIVFVILPNSWAPFDWRMILVHVRHLDVGQKWHCTTENGQKWALTRLNNGRPLYTRVCVCVRFKRTIKTVVISKKAVYVICISVLSHPLSILTTYYARHTPFHRPNSTQLNSTQPNSTQLNSIKLDSQEILY